MTGQLHLRITDQDGARDARFDPGAVVAGRSAEAGLPLNDQLVSRQHGLFEFRDGAWYFLDTNSRNGSSYNGQRLAPMGAVPLRSGDELRIGGAIVTVVTIETAAAMAAPPPVQPVARPEPASTPVTEFPPVTVPMAAAVSGTPADHERLRPVNVGVEDEVIHIGRAIDNDIVVANSYVSSYHLEARIHNGEVVIKDLASKNGTSISGRRLQPFIEETVARGAVLELGPEARVAVDAILAKAHTTPEPSLYQRRPAEAEPVVVGIGLRRVVDRGKKTILNDVTVTLRRGQIIGVVGTSGAGKSTLVKVLNRFTGHEGGTLLHTRDAQGQDIEIGYVPQDDIIHRELPLLEAVVLSAMLRSAPNTPRQQVEARANEVLTELGLSEHRRTVVSRLSGGQRKRASVALELMRRPQMLVLDEPTSGLDPASGRQLMKLLRVLADQGVGVMIVTHHKEDLERVDTIAFLGLGGNLVFWGNQDDALKFFGRSDLTEVYEMLDPTDAGPDTKREIVSGWRQRFEQSHFYGDLQREAQAAQARLAPQLAAPAPVLPPPPGLWQWQLKSMALRYFKIMMADRRNLAILFGQVPVILLLAMVVFKRDALAHVEFGSVRFAPFDAECVTVFNTNEQRKAAGQPEVKAPAKCERLQNPSNGNFLLFIAAATMVWLGTMNAAREICKEAAIWERESQCGVRPLPYVGSKLLVLGGVCAAQALVLVVFLGVLFSKAGGGLPGIFISGFLAALSEVAVGLLISAASPTPERATGLAPLIMIPQIIFGGGVKPISDLGAGKVISYVVSTRWAYQAFGAATDRTDAIRKWDPRRLSEPLGNAVTDAVAKQRGGNVRSIYEQFDTPLVLPLVAMILLSAVFTYGAVYVLQRRTGVTKRAAAPAAPPTPVAPSFPVAQR